MKIIGIKVILTDTADNIILEYPIKEGLWPYEQNATATMLTAHNLGESYVKEHFPDVPYTIINVRTPHVRPTVKSVYGDDDFKPGVA